MTAKHSQTRVLGSSTLTTAVLTTALLVTNTAIAATETTNTNTKFPDELAPDARVLSELNAGSQNANVVEHSSDSTVVYPAAFFQQYSPVSVNDMIDRIPGVSIEGGGNGRGLGSGGNLLINGQRMAGKDNSPRAQLTRIAAREVDRIEIIRGNSTEFDVRNASQIVNVVLNEATSRNSISTEISSDRHSDGTIDPGASVSASGSNNAFNYLFNIMADPRYNHNQRQEYGYSPDMRLRDSTEEHSIRDETAYQASMNLGYRFGNEKFQLNALGRDSSHETDVTRAITDYNTGIPSLRRENENIDNIHYNWEIGGEYEHTFADGSRNVVVFVANDQNRDNVRERFLVNANSGTSETKSLFIESNQRTRERIVRNTYNRQLSPAQDIQLGLERAQTILDSSLFIGANSSTGNRSSRYGDLVPVLSATNPGSTVQEMRYEGFAVHNWTLNDRMSLESTVVYETSEISQSGIVNKTRSFDFVRPKFDYRFDITSSVQLRASVERAVSQLSFANFTASANNSDQDKTSNAGNPDLVQEKATNYELNLEYRLPNDAGIMSSRFVYREIEDVIGRIDVSSNPNAPESAAGNIGDGVRYGVYLDASTRLGFLGLPDAMLTTSLNVFDSVITDPFLGIERRFNGRGNTRIGFRHDLPALNLNYGFTYSVDFNGGQKNIDIDTIERYSSEPNLSFFISKVAFDDITFRFESMNTLNSTFCRERLRYAGTTAANNLREIENSCNNSGQKLALKVRTTF